MKAVTMHKSIVARVSMLALATELAVCFGLVCVIIVLRIATGPFMSKPWLPALLVTAIAVIALGIPLLIGWLASRLISRPLKKFDAALEALHTSDYKTHLSPIGIAEFDAIFASFNTLTDRLHREELLRKDLISDTSHELNTPLAAIIGQLTAMQEGKLDMNKARIGTIRQQADRLAELIAGLDTYTKARLPDAGKVEAVALKPLCQELIDGLSLELEAKGMTVELDMPAVLHIQANRMALSRILQNLFQNALRYSEANKITIAATAQELRFADNGRGVPHDALPHLFERFYRVEKSRNRASGGLGLGLAIVRELTVQQGWNITAVPADPGLQFVVTFKS